jgi:hypothetical protein
MISKTYSFRLVYPVAALALVAMTPTLARADFFDDMRRTFQTDIPHFFQDDIPCAFGGQPTSGTKKACKSVPAHQAKPAATTNAPQDGPDANTPVTNAPATQPQGDTTIEQKQLAPAGASPGSD